MAARVKVKVAATVPAGVDAVIVPVLAGRVVGESRGLDLAYLERRAFDGRPGETQVVQGRDDGVLIAVGLGEPAGLTAERLRKAAAVGLRAAGRVSKLAIALLDVVPADGEGLSVADAAQAIVEGALLASYEFTAFKSNPRPSSLTEIVLVASDKAAATAGTRRGTTVAAGVHLARDLINEPAGSLTPTRFAEVAKAEGTKAGLRVTVLDEGGAVAAGLGGLLGVARGSEQPPCMVELLYEPKGATASTPTIAFVGKGITFDSGGLSLKTGAGMMTMKIDMAGAAAVVAALTIIGTLGAPVRVIGLCAVTENMPSGTAIKPGDVLTIRNGKTVEVLNTDAEGRLVLADGLSLAAEAQVDALVDIATLTGAVATALGRGLAGVMGTDQAWLDEVRDAGARSGELMWQLPLPEEYRRDIDSDVADLRNIAASNPAGSLIAGLFLREFTGGLPWAHLDMAGVARSESGDGYLTPGGTGWGVRTLVTLASSGSVALRPGATRAARWSGRTPIATARAGKPAAAAKGAAAKRVAGERVAAKRAAGKGKASKARKSR